MAADFNPLIANGYSTYTSFLDKIFSADSITYGGPDIRNGSHVVTLGIVAVAPSLLSITDLVSNLKDLGRLASSLNDRAIEDILRANPSEIDDFFVKKTIEQRQQSGFWKTPEYTYNLQGDTLAFNFTGPLQVRDFINFEDFEVRVGGLIVSKFLFTSSATSSTPSLEYKVIPNLFAEINSGEPSGSTTSTQVLEFGRSYYLCVDVTDGYKIKAVPTIEIGGPVDDSVDPLCLFDDSKDISEKALIPISEYSTKIFELKIKGQLPFAVVVIPPSDPQKQNLPVSTPRSTKIRCIKLDTLCLSNPHGTLSDIQTYLLTEGEKNLKAIIGYYSQEKAAYEAKAKSLTIPWASATAMTFPVIDRFAIPTLQYLRHIKDQTSSNQASNSDMSSQILIVLDTLIKYLGMITDFIRQLNIFIKIVTQFFTALSSLSELNIYMLQTPPSMSTTEELKRIYTTATGLPVSEDLYYTAIINVFSVPDPQAMLEKLKSDYGIPVGQPTPEIILNKVKIIEKDNPSTAAKIQELFSFLNKYLFNTK